MTINTGWTPEPQKLPTKQQLVALRDMALAINTQNGKDAAAALDNAIDLFTKMVNDAFIETAIDETISTGLERDGAATGIRQTIIF